MQYLGDTGHDEEGDLDHAVVGTEPPRESDGKLEHNGCGTSTTEDGLFVAVALGRHGSGPNSQSKTQRKATMAMVRITCCVS